MPKKIETIIKEDLDCIKKMYQSSITELRRDRLKMLYSIKRETYCYRSDLAKKLGRSPTTVGLWIKLYEQKGLLGLLQIKSGGNNTKIISSKAIAYITEKLHTTSTTITSYVELQLLIEEDLNQKIPYGALYAHCRRNHKSKLKVSRKVHYKKDPEAEMLFKNTRK